MHLVERVLCVVHLVELHVHMMVRSWGAGGRMNGCALVVRRLEQYQAEDTCVWSVLRNWHESVLRDLSTDMNRIRKDSSSVN